MRYIIIALLALLLYSCSPVSVDCSGYPVAERDACCRENADIPSASGCDGRYMFDEVHGECAYVCEVGNPFSVSYKDGKLSYRATITKPSPCHTLERSIAVLESYPPKVILEVLIQKPDEDKICAQVLTDEVLEGVSVVDTKPGIFTVKVNGNEVFSTEDIGEDQLR